MHEDLSEEEQEEIEELLRGVRPTTKGGGYEEIPRGLILEQAEKVGLSEEDIPEIRIEEVRGGYIDLTPEGKAVIVIPRREPKWKVPDTLRHELSHVKYGYEYQAERTWEDYIRNELGAMRIQGGGKLTSDDLSGLVLNLVLEEDQPRRESTSLVMKEARNMGVSEHSITSAKSWLRSHFKRLKDLQDLL